MHSTRAIARQILASKKKFWKSIYDEEDAHWLDKQPSNLVRKVINKFGPFENVLEIGSAAGVDSFELAKSSESVIGIDIVPDAVELALDNREEQAQEIKDKVKFEEGDAESLQFEDGAFDLVYSLSVLHTTDIDKSIREIDRVLAEGGHAVLYVFIDDLDPEDFIAVCEKYFEVVKKDEKEVTGDEGGDDHTALIVYLEKP